MNTTRNQIETRLMEMLDAGGATEKDAAHAFAWLFDRGYIARDPKTPGCYILSEDIDTVWDELLASFSAPQASELCSYDSQTGYYTIQALGGEDVTRLRTEILVDHHSGSPRNPAHYDAEWSVVGRSELRGWGPLDGPAFELSCNGAWTVSVPVAAWQRMQLIERQFGA